MPSSQSSRVLTKASEQGCKSGESALSLTTAQPHNVKNNDERMMNWPNRWQRRRQIWRMRSKVYCNGIGLHANQISHSAGLHQSWNWSRVSIKSKNSGTLLDWFSNSCPIKPIYRENARKYWPREQPICLRLAEQALQLVWPFISEFYGSSDFKLKLVPVLAVVSAKWGNTQKNNQRFRKVSLTILEKCGRLEVLRSLNETHLLPNYVLTGRRAASIFRM